MNANTLLSLRGYSFPFASSILPVTLDVGGEKESDHGARGVFLPCTPAYPASPQTVKPSRLLSVTFVKNDRARGRVRILIRDGVNSDATSR